MVLLTVITLYTSRVILQQLGVEDFGIYNVVGSVVMMFNSLRTVFASSTQRFLSYEIGRDDTSNLIKIFNVSLKLNFIVSIVFVIIVEVIGLWFISNKINVSPEKLNAVYMVFQFSIAGAVISIFTTSFDAVVIAHEKMGFYAYLSIFEAILRLIICYLLAYSNEKLIAYGFLLLVVGGVIFICNFIYCKIVFAEVKFKRISDGTYFKKMSTFAGWNFFGNTAFAISQNGMNMVLNVFGGPVVNAARGIAYQVSHVLTQFTNNISIVLKPYTIKVFAEGNTEKTFQITYFSSKIYFTVQIIFVITFTFLLKEIISVWLGQLPNYVNEFLTILLWHSLVRSLHSPIDILFYAFGKMKYYQLCEGVCLSSSVLFAYFMLQNKLPMYSAFLAILGVEILNMIIITYIASLQCSFNVRRYVGNVIKPSLLCFVLYLLFYFMKVKYYDDCYLMIFALLILAILSCISTMYFVGLDINEKTILLSLIKNKGFKQK